MLLRSRGTQGIAAMMKSLFYAFTLLPVVSSSGGTPTQLFSGPWMGCALAVFMEGKENIAPTLQSALLCSYQFIMHFSFFVLSGKK